jgi:hypothetical protein
MQRLEDLQQALARVLTDAKLRRQFLESGDTTNASATASSLQSLQGVSGQEIERAATTLYRKRRSQTKSLLPITCQALGEAYPRLFRTYVEQHHFNGLDAIQRDALEFVRWLSQEEAVAAWQVDLARWESFRIAWASQRRICQLVCLRHDIPAWVSQGCDTKSPPNKRSRWFFLWRLHHLGAISQLW